MFDLDECIRDLQSPDTNLRRVALRSLDRQMLALLSLNRQMFNAPGQSNIQLAIPILAEFLSNPDHWIRITVAFTLRNAARFQDIRPAEAALTQLLADPDHNIRKHAYRALAGHHLYQKNWAVLAAWLGHEDRKDISLSFYTSSECACWAITPWDISPLLPALGKALTHPDVQINDHAAVALAYTYLHTGNPEASEQLLRLPWIALGISQRLVNIKMPLECLERLQLLLERSFAAWLPKVHVPSPTVRIAHTCVKVANALQTIGRQKANLAKNDGELLAGETVHYPVPRNCIYSVIQRRSLHGR